MGTNFTPAQDAEEKDKASNSDEGEDIPEIRVDVAGNPLLPSDHVVSIKIRQDLIREIFTKAYGELFYFTLVLF